MAPEAIIAAEANLRLPAFRQPLADRAQLGDQLIERLMVAHLDKILDQSAHSTPPGYRRLHARKPVLRTIDRITQISCMTN